MSEVGLDHEAVKIKSTAEVAVACETFKAGRKCIRSKAWIFLRSWRRSGRGGNRRLGSPRCWDPTTARRRARALDRTPNSSARSCLSPFGTDGSRQAWCTATTTARATTRCDSTSDYPVPKTRFNTQHKKRLRPFVLLLRTLLLRTCAQNFHVTLALYLRAMPNS